MKKRYKILLFCIFNIVFTLLIPFLTVNLIKGDSGMGICMILFFIVYPICSIALGALSSKDAKHFWWMTLAFALSFPLLFSLAMGGMIAELYVYSGVYTFLGYAVLLLIYIMKRIRLERRK